MLCEWTAVLVVPGLLRAVGSSVATCKLSDHVSATPRPCQWNYSAFDFCCGSKVTSFSLQIPRTTDYTAVHRTDNLKHCESSSRCLLEVNTFCMCGSQCMYDTRPPPYLTAAATARDSCQINLQVSPRFDYSSSMTVCLCIVCATDFFFKGWMYDPPKMTYFCEFCR